MEFTKTETDTLIRLVNAEIESQEEALKDICTLVAKYDSDKAMKIFMSPLLETYDDRVVDLENLLIVRDKLSLELTCL